MPDRRVRGAELEQGQALLRVERFGLTANNVTYAVLGQAMSYWDFFPAAGGMGPRPDVGLCRGAAQRGPGCRAGRARVRISTPFLLPRRDARQRWWVWVRRRLAASPGAAPAYQSYLATGADPFYRADTEELQMLLRPLFFTSFLIDDQLSDDGLTARGPIVISSASSKTAIARGVPAGAARGSRARGADLAAERGVRRGSRDLRSHRHLRCDRVAERGAATFVDIAGDGNVRLAVHSHYGEELIHSMTVGITHWEELGAGEGELPGPSPTLFFAPDRAAKRSEDWGRAELQSRVADAWHPFCEWTGGWLEVVEDQGFEAVQRVYLDVLEGRVGPKTANVLSLVE